MTPFSILDLAPIRDGGNATEALLNARDLARHAEALGFRRFWMAEHHSTPGLSSAATSVALAFIGAATNRIRIGAGGIMLPNHAPLVVAEQFGTLESLFPGRVDLGLGRGPGGDPPVAQALRRNQAAGAEQFASDVGELMSYFRPPAPGQPVRAIPGEGLDVPLWMLGSGLSTAELAARLGLPFAFASHFAPRQMAAALELYRSRFVPSPQLDQPYVMLGYNVIAAETDQEAAWLATSAQQMFLNLHLDQPGGLPAPRQGFLESLSQAHRTLLEDRLSCSAIGSPPAVKSVLEDFLRRTGADELIIVTQVSDHDKRLRSFEILAELWGGGQIKGTVSRQHRPLVSPEGVPVITCESPRG